MPEITCVGNSTSGVCDLGIPNCCSHGRSGTNGTGSPRVLVRGKPVHCVDDTGPCNCPHGGEFVSVEGSKSFLIAGKPVTLVGHATVCSVCGKSGNHVDGVPSVVVGK